MWFSFVGFFNIKTANVRRQRKPNNQPENDMKQFWFDGTVALCGATKMQRPASSVVLVTCNAQPNAITGENDCLSARCHRGNERTASTFTRTDVHMQCTHQAQRNLLTAHSHFKGIKFQLKAYQKVKSINVCMWYFVALFYGWNHPASVYGAVKMWRWVGDRRS